MQLTLYTTCRDLAELRPVWNELLASSATDTIFLTWEWCEAWWKNYGTGRSLFVVAARDGGKLVGIAPLYIDPVRRWGISWSRLCLIGDGSQDSDYLDCFAQPGREPEFISALVKFLRAHRQHWDWLELHGPQERSPCLAAWQETAKHAGWKSHRTPIPCATLGLPKTWDAYLEKLQSRFRSKVRSCLRTIGTQFDSTPRECNDPAQLDSWLPALFDLHTRRWNTRKQGGVFGNSVRRSFYRDISRTAMQNGWLAFHRLDWAERPLALQFGFRYRNRFYLLQEGYDPDFETLRPGVCLRAWLIRHWIELGLEEYDFLAGTSSYKMEWGGEQKFSYLLSCAEKVAGQWIALEYPRVRYETKAILRPYVPPTVLELKKNLAASASVQTDDYQPQQPMTKRLALRAASRMYLRTPVGALSRRIAARLAIRNVSGAGHRYQANSVPVTHIFIYHRVNDDRDPFFEAMPTAQFRAHMAYLKKHFRFASLDDISSGGDHSDAYRVVITFDDGYRDNLLHALPILKEFGIPATIFLTTGFIDSSELPWYDRVRLGFKLTMQRRIGLSDLGGPDAPLENKEERLAACARTLAWLRTAEDRSRRDYLAEIFSRLRVPLSCNLPNTMLSWEEVRRMSKEGIRFGAHTITHPALAGVPRERLESEIAGSKKSIEQRLQLPVRHFAYPFGKPADIGPMAKQVVQDAGFETAVTTVMGLNGPEEDRFELKRYSITERDIGVFALKLDWYRMKLMPPSAPRPMFNKPLYREASSQP